MDDNWVPLVDLVITRYGKYRSVFTPCVTVDLMVLISVIFTDGLGFMFYQRGGKIQTIVIEKHSTKYIRSATIIDFCYWIILFIFKRDEQYPNVNDMGVRRSPPLVVSWQSSFTDKKDEDGVSDGDKRLYENDGRSTSICWCSGRSPLTTIRSNV